MECVACYASMKKSMQKEQVLKRREAKRNSLKKSPLKSDENAQSAESKMSDNIPKTMRALVKEKGIKGYVPKTDYPVPTPKEDELLIRSFAVSICGSDTILYNWTAAAQQIAKLPFIPGHEAAGLIVGKGAKCRFKIGDRIAVENHFYCNECYQCKMGRRDICSNLEQFGHGKGTIYGGCCDYYVVKEQYCYRLKRDISWTQAALLEPLGVAHNACTQCDLMKGDNKETVLVVGCGTIGCMAIGVAKNMKSAGKVIAFDVFDDKLKIAQKMGADEVFIVKNLDCSLKEKIMSLTDGVGVGKVIECSGHAPTISAIFGCLRKGGCITLVGLPKTQLVIDDVLNDIIFKSIQIRSVHGRRIFKTWKATEALVADKKIDLEPLISLKVPSSEFEKGFELTASGKAHKGGVDMTK